MGNLSKYNEDGSVLREIQLHMLDILKVFDKICQEYKIPYWLSSGTLLGAVRHGGFIPWDDDLDVELLREDLLRLIPILQKELPKYGLIYQDHHSDPGYLFTHTKIRDLKSHICEQNNIDVNYEYRGLFIDIFALEKTTPIIIKLANIARCYIRLCGHKNDKWGIKRAFDDCCYHVAHGYYSILRLVSKLFKPKYYYDQLGSGYIMKRNPQYIFPLQRIKFEDIEFNAPADCDAFLRDAFGDYRRLPPESERCGHIIDADFICNKK